MIIFKKSNFRNIYNCSVLAIRHRNELVRQNISEIYLRAGDLLIIYGTEDEIAELVNQKLLIVLSEYKEKKVDYKKALPALLIAIGVVSAAAFELTSILL